MAGLAELLRLALRRDRVMLPAWVLGLGAAVLLTASSYADLYADPASRREVVTTLGETPATLALYGRIYADTVGGLVGWRLGGIALALAGLMAICSSRATRARRRRRAARSCSGAAVVARGAPLAAALIVAATAAVALGVVGDARRARRAAAATTARPPRLAGRATLIYTGAPRRRHRHRSRRGTRPRRDVRRRRARLRGRRRGHRAGHGVLAGGERARGRRARRGVRDPRHRRRRAALGVVAVADRLGPAGPRARGEPLACPAASARARGGAHLRRRRPPRPPRPRRRALPAAPGPARGRLSTPFGLAWRLQRGALIGWTAGFAILGAAFGSIAQDVGDVIGDSADVKDALQTLGGQQDLVDAYLAATFGILALIAAAYAIQATLRLRGEETSGRAEPILATGTSRTRWALSHAVVAFGGATVLLGAAGLAAGLAHAAQTSDAGRSHASSGRHSRRPPPPGCSPRSRSCSSAPSHAAPPRPGARSRSPSRWSSSARSPTSRRR